MIYLYLGITGPLPYTIHQVYSRNEYSPRTSKERHAPTPDVSAIPQPLLALSNIQIRMWFVRYTASFIYWCQLIYEMVNIAVNDIFNEGVTWLLMKVLWFLMNGRPPDQHYEANGIIIIKRQTRGHLKRLFRVLVYLILFTGCVAKAHDNSGNEETDLHVAELKDLIVHPSKYYMPVQQKQDKMSQTTRQEK
jgi:hypothetical protein